MLFVFLPFASPYRQWLPLGRVLVFTQMVLLHGCGPSNLVTSDSGYVIPLYGCEWCYEGIHPFALACQHCSHRLACFVCHFYGIFFNSPMYQRGMVKSAAEFMNQTILDLTTDSNDSGFALGVQQPVLFYTLPTSSSRWCSQSQSNICSHSTWYTYALIFFLSDFRPCESLRLEHSAVGSKRSGLSRLWEIIKIQCMACKAGVQKFEDEVPAVVR